MKNLVFYGVCLLFVVGWGYTVHHHHGWTTATALFLGLGVLSGVVLLFDQSRWLKLFQLIVFAGFGFAMEVLVESVDISVAMRSVLSPRGGLTAAGLWGFSRILWSTVGLAFIAAVGWFASSAKKSK